MDHGFEMNQSAFDSNFLEEGVLNSTILNEQNQMDSFKGNLSTNSKQLTNEEFDSLIKTVQLLRISQLRFIVQKFSIPASGNKTKLLNLVIQIFHNLRFDTILVEIHKEIGILLSQQGAPFAPPTNVTGTLTITQMDSNYQYIPFPTFRINLNNILLGPILVTNGFSSGKFNFSNISNSLICLTFLYQNKEEIPFSLQFEVNGIPFEIFQEDPFKSPIDLTSFLTNENTLDIKSLNCHSNMMIIISQYEYIGLNELFYSIVGNYQNISIENTLVKTNNCQHLNGFNLIKHLSEGLTINKWNCPICGLSALPESLILITNNNSNVFLSPQNSFSNQLFFNNLENFDCDSF